MFVPPSFQEVDAKEIAHLIEQFPLATIVCQQNGEFIANHIPLLCVGENKYVGHIAKENDLHLIFPNGTNAIAVFSAQDTYISPNWYPTKAKTHRLVPTWNYQVVHLKGHIRFDYSKKGCLAAVGKLTKKYEKIHSGDKAWKMSDAPKDYMDQMLENIVAFTFDVKSIIAKSKISQNREKEDFDSVAQKMKEHNNNFLANSMIRVKKVD